MTILYIIGAFIIASLYVFLYLLAGKAGRSLVAYLLYGLNNMIDPSYGYLSCKEEANSSYAKIMWPIFIVLLIAAIIITILVVMTYVVIRGVIAVIKELVMLLWASLKLIGQAFEWAWK